MPLPKRVSALLSALALCTATAAAFAQERAATIGVEEIRAGMRGYGLTVFRGTEPERFDVEVIDVLRNFRPDQDLILIRTPHPVLDEAIVVGGMSGSPIYLDGRLAGAYAYGWTFGTEPIAGVTPIASMFAEIDRPYRPASFPGATLRPSDRRGAARARKRGGRAAGASRPRAGLLGRRGGLDAYQGGPVGPFDTLDAHAIAAGLASERGDSAPGRRGPARLRPASTPLMLGGFTDEIANLLGERLEPFGLVTLQAGGGSSAPSPGARPAFVDGGAIGVQLIGGDINATAIGPVTHVRGNRVVAFGHPMMNAGEVGLPTATARILHVFRSQARSFKIAEAQEPLGTLVHDRQSAIVIDTDLQAATVPMRIRLHGLDGAPRTEWNVRLASHRILTPVLAFSALANALGASAADHTDVMYRAISEVTIEGHGAVTVEDQGYMPSGPADTRRLSGLRLFELLEVGFGNAFEPSRITNVTVDLHLRFANEVLHIAEVSVPAEQVDPGTIVHAQITLRQYGRPDTLRVVPFRIPESAAGETLEISFQAGDAVQIEQGAPRSIADLVRGVEAGFPATSLAITLKMPSRGLRFRGHVVRALPRSALDTLQLVAGTEPGRPFVTQDRQLIEMGRVLDGSATLRLRVRDAMR